MKLKKISINTLLALVLLAPTITAAQSILKPRTITSIGMNDPYCNSGGYLETALGLETDEAKCSGITIMDTSIKHLSDWVLLELRAVDSGNEVGSATTGTVVTRKPAFLLTNGYVVDAEEYGGTDACNNFDPNDPINCPPVEFDFDGNDDILNKDLYVVVRHLNHLDVISNASMSTATVSMRTRYMYNFTTITEGETNTARGGNLGLKIVNIQNDAMEAMGAMYVGDVNSDSNINAADYLQIYRDIGTMSKASDLDFDDDVDAGDASSRLGENLGRTTQLP